MPHANYLTASLAVLCGACVIAIPMAPSLVTEELDMAQMAFMADDECRERGCALAALQLRSSLDTVMESTAIQTASMLSDDRTAFAEAPSAPTRYGAWDPTTSVTSNARSIANSSSSPLSNATAASTGNSTPNASSEANSTPGGGPQAGNRSAAEGKARGPAPGTTPPAAADSAKGSPTGNASVPASGNETDAATGNKAGGAPSSPTIANISDSEAPRLTNGSATGNSSNGSAGGDGGNGTEAANATGAPCSTCALYDPSARGLDWTGIPAPCYNLAQTKAMIENGTWCCESFIPESMTAHPTSCFTAPNKGSWPCYSPDRTACS